ncbi:MAG: TonB family protein [Betaproteobacteria bacterium]|nr:TonB family protein [Betaproteobacteria bacterium]
MHKNSLPLAALVLSIALHGALLCLWPQQGRVGVAPARVLYVEFAAGVPKAGEPESQVRSAPGHRSERKVAASRSRPFHGVTEVAPAAIPASPESPPGGARQAVLSAEAAAERAMPAHAVINAKTDSQAARNEADLLAGYGQALSRAIARQQRYPRIAQVKGWQGTVEIAMQIAPGTRLQQVTVLRSSGFDVLDQHALEMVRDAAPLPPAPEPLRSSEFSVRMPIVFRLND